MLKPTFTTHCFGTIWIVLKVSEVSVSIDLSIYLCFYSHKLLPDCSGKSGQLFAQWNLDPQ